MYKIDTDDSGAKSVASNTAASTPSAPAVEAPKPVAAQSSAPTDFPVPSMGDSITQGVLAKWLVSVGSNVAVDQAIASIETDKLTIDIRAPVAGVLTAVYSEEGADVFVDHKLFSITPSVGGAAAAAPATPKAAENKAPAAAKAPAAPASAPKASDAAKPAAPKAAEPASKPVAAGDRSETRVKLTRMRQRISQRLKESQNTAAMLTTFQEVDMTNIIDIRNRYKDDFEKKHKVKLGFMSAFVKAASAALQEIPAVNAVIDDATQEVVYRNYVDISVAVASPTGLVVPVLRNCEKMNFADVEKSIGDYGKKAKEGGLAVEDMVGGTFTISNGGVFGSLFGTPIINPPQSAILGMHATKMRAVVVNGKVEARPMMYLALTYDHRLIDGREAVTFLKSIANKIEDPSRLLLEV